jgi:NADH-quinone oxidoreductase subunit G
MGQARGAQSGEADRHGVWLAAHHLEPKLSPFDPFAIFDEIQRLVPSYHVPRLDLLAGNDQHVKAALVQIEGIAARPDLVLPSNDTLFTSGSLGFYSKTLHSVLESRKSVETAAD